MRSNRLHDSANSKAEYSLPAFIIAEQIAFPNLAEKFLEERKAKEENVVSYSIVEA